ncbi:hypothetical protein PINS_up021963 [Pythium insidiosum]|nr:hypothetical protein PINS_up021963 [Pythium insidiosum]
MTVRLARSRTTARGTRVITDSPLVALFAQNLLVRVPTKDPHAARPIVVYVATEGEFKGKEPQALLFSTRMRRNSSS